MASFSHLACLVAILLLIENVCSMNPLCHSNERSALLQFKQSFVIDSSASGDSSSYPKVSSWDNSNCCLWDGVECDQVSGHVIALDLTSSCLYGSFNSTSRLFKLSHLQRLNLADNNFNFSKIPPTIASLSNLIYLNLSFSNFFGQIPMQISELHNLTFLDLHGNYDFENDVYYLSLVDFRRLVQNLRKLEALDLSRVDISSSLPDIFMNLHSLTSLSMRGCGLIGAIPFSLGELTKLAFLGLSSNRFAGEVPSSLENLTELVKLDLSDNNFTEGGFSWLGKQTKLKYLKLMNVNLVGEIPFCLKNLTQLEYLSLTKNNLKSQIPSWLSNLTHLTQLHLAQNELHGSIPESISQLVNLERLNLGYNNLSGILRFEMFSEMKQMNALHLPYNNNLTLLVDDDRINATLSKWQWLGLGGCNLRQFPDFIRYQNQLYLLGLRGNNIEGHIPSWIGNVGTETLHILDLSHNYFSSFERPLTFSLFKNLVSLDLSYNKLQGPLPPPPLSIQYYYGSDNNFTGEISPWFCSLRSSVVIDLSNNKLNGIIPQCLVSSIYSLAYLILTGNHFNGNIPDSFGNRSKLKVISLSHNHLGGSLPRSLGNCKMLQLLDLSGNQIHDKFPIWLGSLQELQLVILRSNHLFGELEILDKFSHFPKLRLLDLAQNEFIGTIPSGFFQTFNNMKAFDKDHEVAYMEGQLNSMKEDTTVSFVFTPWIYVANKGMYMRYGKIPKVLAAIDFSSNKFQGGIPESITNLKMVNVLDFSNNHLSGPIPSFLRNLTNLESLDLSNNKFSGKVSQSLTELTFLSYFNVSNNQLTGSILQGNQFGTFENTSYLGNSGLCGAPLTKQCGNPEASALPHDGGSKLPIDVTWKSVAVGYGSGIVVGVVLGLVFYERHQNWVLYTYGRWHNRRPRARARHTIR